MIRPRLTTIKARAMCLFWYRLSAALLLMGLVSLSCTYTQTSNFVQTLTYRTATPDITATGIAQLTATVMHGKVGETLGKKELIIILDPLGERDVTSVQVDAIEFAQSFLVESVDPLGRYLPNVGEFPKNRDPVQQIVLTQVGAEWLWSARPIESLDTASLASQKLGDMTLANLTQYLTSVWDRGPINIILPVQDTYKDTDTYNVYQTPAAHTILLTTSSTAASGGKLAAPKKVAASYQYVIFSFLTPSTLPITNFITQVQNVQVGNYTGVTAAEINWAETKVKESPKGVPEGYVPTTAGISEEIINWLNYDQVFVRSAFYLKSTQIQEPCTKQESLNKIIRQEPEAGKTLNALKDTVKLVICKEVVTQKKYETLMYVSPTVTNTNTPVPTRTSIPTITSTPTATTAPTNTPKPTNTAQPTNTTAPTATTAPSATTAPTATTAPSATATQTPTATLTTTPAAPIRDDFETSPNGYNPAVWTVFDAGGGGVRTWPREQRMRQEINAVTDDMKLQSKKACLWGRTDIKLRTSETGDGSFQYGWMDTTDYNTATYGIYVRSDPADVDNTKIIFATREGGIETNAETVTLSSDTYGVYHTFRITWEVLNDVYIQANLYVDGDTTPAKSYTNISYPANRLNFVLGNSVVTAAGGNTSILEVEYVYVYSDNCQ
ncbi:MAG: hypothetical protein HPY45_12330 [Anaerolineae bacterium]|nr:hypothetical protein [Anaerolineae bacterium]